MLADLNLAVPNVWQHVREVRARVAAALAHLPSELREATEMTAAELVENAIKYGDEVPACTDVRISMRAVDGALQLQVSNGVTNAASLRRVKERIAEIHGGTPHEALYLQRLRHLMDHPEESGSLGLYRIAFEGRFDLSYAVQDEVLSITASRTLESSAS